jgi:hypothetical protein
MHAMGAWSRDFNAEVFFKQPRTVCDAQVLDIKSGRKREINICIILNLCMQTFHVDGQWPQVQ